MRVERLQCNVSTGSTVLQESIQTHGQTITIRNNKPDVYRKILYYLQAVIPKDQV
ncbi:hypothetical protein [Adhaeribacter terrigena]|uniref:hypothetical protein n=1 Tax=Adhaeribacter terrigena TaxID=2793070 RepID=UPI00190E3E2C|nr:hypothetical protein [Adhaeribacter terrigena]